MNWQLKVLSFINPSYICWAIETVPVIFKLELCLPFILQLVQMYHQKLNYIGFVNILEWFIYILSILFVLPLSGVSYPYMDGADCTESGAECVSVTLVRYRFTIMV